MGARPRHADGSGIVYMTHVPSLAEAKTASFGRADLVRSALQFLACPAALLGPAADDDLPIARADAKLAARDRRLRERVQDVRCADFDPGTVGAESEVVQPVEALHG